MNHEVHLSRGVHRGPWLASCSCGWVGHSQPGESMAQREHDEHATYLIRLEEN